MKYLSILAFISSLVMGCTTAYKKDCSPALFIQGGIYRPMKGWKLRQVECESCKRFFCGEDVVQDSKALGLNNRDDICKECQETALVWANRLNEELIDICNYFPKVCKTDVRNEFLYLLTDQLKCEADETYFSIDGINHIGEKQYVENQQIMQTFVLCRQEEFPPYPIAFKTFFMAPSKNRGVYIGGLDDIQFWAGTSYQFSFEEYRLLYEIIWDRDKLGILSPLNTNESSKTINGLLASQHPILRYDLLYSKQFPSLDNCYLFSFDALDCNFLYFSDIKQLFILAPTLGLGNKYDVYLLDNCIEMEGSFPVKNAILLLDKILVENP